MLHQSCTMACGIKVIAVFLACATAASHAFAPFPHGKTTTYQYNTVVKTTIYDEGSYSSQFVVQGTLDITHDTRDPELVNSYNVALSNVATDMHNGKTMDYSEKIVLGSVDSAAKVIQEPFLIIYSPNGTLQAVKIYENEPEWSKNIKMAMASMLQLNLPNISLENFISKPHTFVSQEKTIHGDCLVTYEIYSKDRINENIPEEFNVNKTYSPMDCIGFSVDEFNNVDNENSADTSERPMLIESSREFEIEKQSEGFLIKKLSAFGVVRSLSTNPASFPHFVITNTTFDFLQVKEKSEKDTRLGNFVNSPIIYDLTYRKPKGNYVRNAAVDVTQGRHVVNLFSLSSQLKKLLFEAVDYLEANHLDPYKMDWNQAQTINKILHTMSYMDADALQAAFSIFENEDLPKVMKIKKIFLDVVSQVGTPASCEFTLNIILKNEISAWTAIEMLSNLPLSVKVPTTELLARMEDLANFDNSISAEVRKAAIISFSSLIYRTFKHVPRPEDSIILKKYLHNFLDHVKNEPTYEMKVVYLMAIKNIQVGKIYDLLEPIIKGDLAISKKPEHIQLLSIWAIDKAVEKDFSIARRILWPVMVNEALSMKLRIAAYEILMNQAPNEETALNVHNYVSSQGNKHFYNYHYTTLDSIAKSEDESKVNIRKIVTSILEETPYPPKGQENIRYPLSGVFSIGYLSQRYVDAEKIDIGVVVNESTGIPEILQHKYIVTDNYGSVSEIAMQVHIEGHHKIMELLHLSDLNHGVKPTMIPDLLDKAAKFAPAATNLHVDIILLRNGRVFIANHYNSENLGDILNHMVDYFYYYMRESYAVNYQNVVFERLYEKQLTSDIGVPVVVESRIPVVSSMNINYTNTNVGHSQLALDTVFEFKTWKHDDYSMSIYNPMKDIWHGVHSRTLAETSLPIRMNWAIGTGQFLKFSFPERSEMNPAVVGFVVRSKHLVTIDEEGTEALKEFCQTCHHQEDVRDDSKRERFDRRQEHPNEDKEKTFDSKDTGLKFSSYVYTCEFGFMSEMYLGYTLRSHKSFISNITNNWLDLPLQVAMDIRHAWKDFVFLMQMGSCGIILKAEPSTNYSISHIDVNLSGGYEDFDRNELNLESPHAGKIMSSVSFNMISSLTNTTARSWIFGVNVDMDRGHLNNYVSVDITRKTPEEQNLKICIDVKKNYPTAPADVLKLVGTNEEVVSRLTAAFGYTNDDHHCVRNQTMLSVLVKAQLSNEQKKRFKYDMENSACSNDTNNPSYASPNNLVPRTRNCLNEAIRYTSPRKYSFVLTHEKLSPGFAYFMYNTFTDNVESRESGKIKFHVEFPMETNRIDLHLMTNTSEYSDFNFDLQSLTTYGQGPVLNSLWDFPLDNSRFSLQYLFDYTNDNIRTCSIYPQIVQTGDGDNVPFNIPSDAWVLISGDNYLKDFAIFAKQTRPNYLSFRLLTNNHDIHFFTRESDNSLVAIADGNLPETKVDFRLPLDEDYNWNLKITKRNDQFVVRMRTRPLTLHIGSNYMFLVFHHKFQGFVLGLCGRLNGMIYDGKIEIYSIEKIRGY